MSDTTTITVRVNTQLKNDLERLAKSTKRSKSYLAAEAIADYVAVNAWQVEEIRWLDDAIADVTEIYRCIAADNPDAAARVVARIQAAVGRLRVAGAARASL